MVLLGITLVVSTFLVEIVGKLLDGLHTFRKTRRKAKSTMLLISTDNVRKIIVQNQRTHTYIYEYNVVEKESLISRRTYLSDKIQYR